MSFENKDFIIKSYKDKKTAKTKDVLRRYKGKESVVVVPDGVKAIGDYVFADDVEPNEFIEKIVIPDSVTEISLRAFAWCMALKEIVFPKKMLCFRLDFSHCPSLEEINVPDSVKRIRDINLCCTGSIKRINVGENICDIEIVVFSRKDKPVTILPGKINPVLLKNPAYVIKKNFVVNKKHKISLARLELDKKVVRIPDGIETIGPNTFYELYQYTKNVSDMTPVEKVVIPASVKKIREMAFYGCNSLKEVVYEGFSKDIAIDKWAFFMCMNFHKDGREIICKDTPKPKEKKTRTTNLKIDRLILIHKMVKSGCYPSLKEIVNVCRYDLGMGTCSPSTINRDIELLRNRFNAPLDYDRFKNGYYYADKDFIIDFDRIGSL